MPPEIDLLAEEDALAELLRLKALEREGKLIAETESFPWTIQKRGTQWCVVKEGTNDSVGCHPTEARARAQQRALYREAAADESTVPLVEDTTTGTGGAEVYISGTATWSPNVMEETVEVEEEVRGPRWHGILALEGKPTSDKRMLIPGEIEYRDLPRALQVQLKTAPQHEGSPTAGRIEEVEHIPIADFSEELKERFRLSDELPESTVVIWATGTFDTSEYADEAQRMISNGAGISIDLTRERAALYDPETMEEVDEKGLELEDLLFGNYIQGIGGKIAAATIVTVEAIEEASIQVIEDHVLVASAWGLALDRPLTLVASAGPLRPPREWFQDPNFKELTPWTITKEGRVFGHLADHDGCHIGFQGVCVPPFGSPSNYGVFNATCGAGIETAEGEVVPCGKYMFSRSGAGHAPTDTSMSHQEVQRWYDDATKVGAYIRAGRDRFGTWVAGALRSDLTELEIQHIRTHPPSGDWRPVKGQGDLVAAFGVPIGGFPIVRRALVASADGEITAIITAPLQITDEDRARSRIRKRLMLSERLKDALGVKERTRAQLRQEAMQTSGPWLDDFKMYTAEQRQRMAKTGAAMPDGSYPIADCADWDNARRAIGRSPASRRPAVRAHINKRGNSLGCSAAD